MTWAMVCSKRTAWPQAALISSHSTGQLLVLPSRKPLMVPKGPSCQMLNTSLYTLVACSRVRCSSERQICNQHQWSASRSRHSGSAAMGL